MSELLSKELAEQWVISCQFYEGNGSYISANQFLEAIKSGDLSPQPQAGGDGLMPPDEARKALAAFCRPEYRDYILNKLAGDFAGSLVELLNTRPHIPAQQDGSDLKAAILAELCKDQLIEMFTRQKFWHAHHIDLVWRYNGEDRRVEGDWVKNIWSLVTPHPGAEG